MNWIKFKSEVIPRVYQEIYVKEENNDLFIKIGGEEYPEIKFDLHFYTKLYSEKEIKRIIKQRLKPYSNDLVDDIYVEFVKWYKGVLEDWEAQWATEEVEEASLTPETYAERVYNSILSSEDDDIKEILIDETEYWKFIALLKSIARGEAKLGKKYDFVKDLFNDYEINLSSSVSDLKKLPFLPHYLLDTYIDFTDERHKLLCCVWVLGTYVHQLFTHYPYLWINAPKSSGKTKLTKILSWCSYHGLITGGQSPSSIYYAVDKLHATLGIDEAEKLSNSERSAEINNILLAGFEKNLSIMRVPKKSDGTNELREFKVYSPKIITNITGISNDALESRMIPLRLIRSKNPVKVNKNPVRSDKLFDLSQIIGCVWAFENWERVKEEYLREYPDEQVIVGRNYTLFKPLLSVCRVAFPDLYEEFFEYCKSLNEDIVVDLSENTIEVLFLKTVKAVYDDVDNGLVEVIGDGWLLLRDLRIKFKELFYPEKDYSLQWFSRKLNEGRRLLGFKKRTVNGVVQYYFC